MDVEYWNRTLVVLLDKSKKSKKIRYSIYLRLSSVFKLYKNKYLIDEINIMTCKEENFFLL